MSKCPHISWHPRVWCAAGEHPRRQCAAWYANATCWYDYSTGCSMCFRLVINNLFEDFVNRCQDNKRRHCCLWAQLHSPTATAIYLPFSSLINMEMSRSLLLVKKKAVTSLVTDSMDVFGLQGLLFFWEHVLSLFRQRIKNVNMASLASVSKLNSMILNAWQNPPNRQTAFDNLSLLLSPKDLAVNFSKGKLLNLQHWLVKALGLLFLSLHCKIGGV